MGHTLCLALILAVRILTRTPGPVVRIYTPQFSVEGA